MPDLATLHALAEAANKPEPPPTDDYHDAWLMWREAREAYLAAVRDPAIVLALLDVVEAARTYRPAMFHELSCDWPQKSPVCACGLSVLKRALAALTTKEPTDAR